MSVRVPEWAPSRERAAYLQATYPEGDWPETAHTSTGAVRDQRGSRATESCVCGAKFEGSRQDAADFVEAHESHQPKHRECCGAEL